SPAVLRELVRTLDQTAYPILIHCQRGSDRTGLVSAIALLLQEGASLADARRQVGPRFGHLPISRTVAMDPFLDFYEGGLKAAGQEHSAQRFRHWLLHEYRPGAYVARVELLDCPLPLRPARGQACPLRVRCHNLSEHTWHLKPGDNAGIHLH